MNKTAIVIILIFCLIGAIATNYFVWDDSQSFSKIKVGIKTIFWIVIISSMGLNLIAFLTAPQEMRDGIKRWWAKWRYKNVFSRIEFINADASATEIYVRTRDSKMEFEGMPFFINPKKAIRKRGVNTFTFVNKNTFGHDFINEPSDVLKKIIQDCKSIRTTPHGDIKDLTDNVHEIYAEPYRYDARMVKEALTNAQLSAAQQLHELLKLFSNKNIVLIGGIILVAAGAAALFGFMSFNEFQAVEICRTTAESQIHL